MTPPLRWWCPICLLLLAVISVFTPSFFMVGATQSLFVPLSLAVGYAMLASYFLSTTFVPVMSGWLLKHSPHQSTDAEIHNGANKKDLMERLKKHYQRFVALLFRGRLVVFAAYGLCILSAVAIYPTLGSEIFPTGNPKGFQLRLKALRMPISVYIFGIVD